MALDQEQIEGLINRIIHKSKDAVGVSYNMGHVEVEQKYIPNYYSGYRKAVKQMQRIAPHANVDVFPEQLFAHRAPNQSDEGGQLFAQHIPLHHTPRFCRLCQFGVARFERGELVVGICKRRW